MKLRSVSMMVAATLSVFALNLSALELPADLDGALSLLRAAIDDVDYANDRDQTGLFGKLDAAEAKIAEGKPCDASDKILDLQAKVRSLRDARKPKIFDGASYTVQDILDAADHVIDLLGGPCN